jgi:hypothetical protein
MLLLMAMLLIACQSSDEDNGSPDDCYLDIYVYAPGRPIVTRGDVGEVSPSDAEKKVNTLQIWVFKSGSGALVGHLSVTNPTYLNGSAGQEKYRMLVDKAFANAPEDVDVYVVANEASCGLSFDKNTTRADLDAAQIGTGYFGTTNCYGQGDLILPEGRIATNGLPMSAVAKNQPITGSFPALRIGSQDQMTILRLTRAVSKLRFVLCQNKNNTSERDLVSIDGITLSGNQIPEQTSLMPGTTAYSRYTSDALTFVDESNKLFPKTDEVTDGIPSVADPMIYQYETQKAQDYEDMINAAVAAGNLKQIGLTYLRESDKQLTGTITYTYSEGGNNHSESIDFSMAAPGDFLRNHSWIVYIFYMGAKIHVHVVTDIGMKNWTPDNEQDDVIVYNW